MAHKKGVGSSKNGRESEMTEREMCQIRWRVDYDETNTLGSQNDRECNMPMGSPSTTNCF